MRFYPTVVGRNKDVRDLCTVENLSKRSRLTYHLRYVWFFYHILYTFFTNFKFKCNLPGCTNTWFLSLNGGCNITSGFSLVNNNMYLIKNPVHILTDRQNDCASRVLRPYRGRNVLIATGVRANKTM